jgi:hypothetical protein
MTLFNSDYIEISSWEQFQKLSSLYIGFCVFVYSDSISWSHKILFDDTINGFFSKNLTKLFTINLSKYPDFEEYLDINIFPTFLVYRNKSKITQVSPLFENLTDILQEIIC